MFQHSETVSDKSVSRKLKRYGRIPMNLLLDKSVSSEAVRIYGILAASVFQGNVATIGMRRIGALIGKSPATVMRRLRELTEATHIKPGQRKNGQRAFYVLTSPVFGQKQRAGVEELVSSPSRGRRLASVRTA